MIMMHLSVLLLNFKISSTDMCHYCNFSRVKENTSEYQSTLDMKDLSCITMKEKGCKEFKREAWL